MKSNWNQLMKIRAHLLVDVVQGQSGGEMDCFVDEDTPMGSVQVGTFDLGCPSPVRPEHQSGNWIYSYSHRFVHVSSNHHELEFKATNLIYFTVGTINIIRIHPHFIFIIIVNGRLKRRRPWTHSIYLNSLVLIH